MTTIEDVRVEVEEALIRAERRGYERGAAALPTLLAWIESSPTMSDTVVAQRIAKRILSLMTGTHLAANGGDDD